MLFALKENPLNTLIKFDRHRILFYHYKQQIASWNWSALRAEAEKNVEDFEGEKYGCVYIGSVFGLTPSGKIYAFWTTNQTRADVTKDECWWEALETVAGDNGMWVGSPGDSGDGDGIYLSMSIE